MRLLIIGCGDIGTRVGELMLTRGWSIDAVRRNAALLPDTFSGHSLDYSSDRELGALAQCAPDYVLVTPTPQSYDIAGYEAGFLGCARALAAQTWLPHCRRIIWVSSTRVYRERDGGWVDESSALNLEEGQAAALVRAEAVIRRAARSTVIRPAGIYGDPNGMLFRRVASGQQGAGDARYGNRIHRQDLARLIECVLTRDASSLWAPPTLVAADDDHAPISEIEVWLAAQMSVSLVPAESSGRSRADRRCSNALLRQIGFCLEFPTWREGYQAALRDRQSNTP